MGTRGSALALWQSNAIADMLRAAHPHLHVSLEIIETKGDKVLDLALSKIGDKGLFTKELENALLERRVDIAVHSLKDMQTELPEGLTLGAVTERASPEDALIAQPGTTLHTIPEGGIVATGSLRRRAQLLSLRPDLQIVDVRGNVGTRLQKYRDGGWDGMILARAGLERLGLENEIAQIIPADLMVPAVGQGALGIEIPVDDPNVASIVAAIEHRPTRQVTDEERAFLRRLEGGCQAPIAAHGWIVGEELRLTGLVASLDGREIVRKNRTGNLDKEIGRELAEDVLREGGEIILEGISIGR
ncbi:MAG: hydroxymethylbilane synthase [Candidatus Kapaibacterium sp.]